MFYLPRMLMCLVLTLALMISALLLQAHWPGTLVAVTAYKAHLMSMGGWGGYWLDRALFPYARPDSYLSGSNTDRTASCFTAAQLRRAIVVAACLVCVGLGA
ncbi:MAG: hypothetical protein A2Z93_06275 [Curvibacter sp. GWA2_64_110]|nr:MAG: hypothetical protein A2Z93_06275 [Curvibacter sp. GWA2_64_110]HCY15595.1 hypothetical protein [Curvibacter sp.]